ncbi:hypothetical protein [Achromobacter kerstersii]|uniref:Uncharacterized protein n=1 Tax=Achromobacter kerstersii TaxID=1353890 RepID=A0A6S7ARI9_9BURK|nr:hypothetical protein [Achromobacter kerstersii]CAB3732656.1 hypothetical protein LMG3441_04834 [Achromobacter kerstersii]
MQPDVQSGPQSGAAPARTRVEFLYREILVESDQLLTRMEQLTSRQTEIQQAMQALPGSIRQAGMDAASLAAEHANRSLLEASRTIAKATSDLRVASRMATNALPSAAWRTGLLCAASAFVGGAFSATLVAIALYR